MKSNPTKCVLQNFRKMLEDMFVLKSSNELFSLISRVISCQSSEAATEDFL